MQIVATLLEANTVSILKVLTRPLRSGPQVHETIIQLIVTCLLINSTDATSILTFMLTFCVDCYE